MGTVAIVVPDHCDGAGTRPADSPGKFTSVFSPIPKALIYGSKLFMPSCWAISMDPMSDEWARMSEAVHSKVGWAQASLKILPSTA